MDSEPEIESLYLRYGPMVLRRSRQILKSDADAEEALHDVFTIVVAKRHTFRGEASIATWMYRITTRLCLKRLRKRARQESLLHSRSERAHPAVQDAESAAILRNILALLPERLATVAIYFYVDGLTHDEIASMLDCSRRQVGYLLDAFHAKAARLVGAPQRDVGGQG